MSESSLPPAASSSLDRQSRHLHQQHKLAKDLIRAARAGDNAATARLAAAFPGLTRAFQLADAQLVVAREAEFESWAKLVKHVEQQELAAAGKALHAGDAAELRRLLAGSEFLQSKVNAPLFDFGRRAIHAAANKPALVDVLLEFGADPNLKSDWANGPYTPLDDADDPAARHLIARGAQLTPNAAARLGWIDELRAMLDDDPTLVHARGGDGKQPLHEAKSIEIADLLLDRGADIDARCIDHKSTPAQYALVDRPEICRHLLARGAAADIFIAARLNDPALVDRLLEDDPSCANARINFEGYAAVPPFNIYCWTLGWYKSPYMVAIEAGGGDAPTMILQAADARTRLIDPILLGRHAAIDPADAEVRAGVALLTPQDHKLLAHAAHLRLDDAFKVMLRLGFDPLATGLDGGTALHQAAWTGAADLVELLLKSRKWDLEIRDPTHGSTPLGWAAHGSANCCHGNGDYVRTVKLLLSAGARIDVPGNRLGTSMIDQANGNVQVQEALRLSP